MLQSSLLSLPARRLTNSVMPETVWRRILTRRMGATSSQNIVIAGENDTAATWTKYFHCALRQYAYDMMLYGLPLDAFLLLCECFEII